LPFPAFHFFPFLKVIFFFFSARVLQACDLGFSLSCAVVSQGCGRAFSEARHLESIPPIPPLCPPNLLLPFPCNSPSRIEGNIFPFSPLSGLIFVAIWFSCPMLALPFLCRSGRPLIILSSSLHQPFQISMNEWETVLPPVTRTTTITRAPLHSHGSLVFPPFHARCRGPVIRRVTRQFLGAMSFLVRPPSPTAGDLFSSSPTSSYLYNGGPTSPLGELLLPARGFVDRAATFPLVEPRVPFSRNRSLSSHAPDCALRSMWFAARAIERLSWGHKARSVERSLHGPPVLEFCRCFFNPALFFPPSTGTSHLA